MDQPTNGNGADHKPTPSLYPNMMPQRRAALERILQQMQDAPVLKVMPPPSRRLLLGGIAAVTLVIILIASLLVYQHVGPARYSIVEYAIPTSSSSPRGITLGSDGNLWFTEYLGNKIARSTLHGQITEFTIPTANAQPYGITTGPDGNLWFVENGANQIGRIVV